MKPIKSLYQNENYPHSQCSKDRSNVFLLEAFNFFLTIPYLMLASTFIKKRPFRRLPLARTVPQFPWYLSYWPTE